MRMGIARGRLAPPPPRQHRTRGGLRGLAGRVVATALLSTTLLASVLLSTASAQEPGPPAPAPAGTLPEDVLSPPSPRIVALTGETDAAVSAAAMDARIAEQASGAVPPPPGDPSGDTLEVFLDHAKIIRLPERTQTVIVGNPFIADVTVQRNGILVVTGKSYGATNLIALDAQGLLLAESMVSVRAPTDSVVVVQRGLARESYSCTPNCQPSLRLGDAPEYFGAVGSQATQRSGFAGQ